MKSHCEPGGASFSSHNMWKWLFHPLLRWINSVWIEIVFSSGKIHTLNMWNSFVSIVIFSSYYKWRKNVHEVFSSLDQFWEISKCSFFICFSWWKVHMRFFIPGWISAKISKCNFFICFNWWKVHMRFFFIPGSISAEIPSGEFQLKLIQEIYFLYYLLMKSTSDWF